MDVLSGGGDGGERPLRLSTPSRQKRHYVKRRASLSMLPLSDTFLFKAPQPTYVASSWPGELCVLGSSVCLALERLGGASRVVLFCHGTSSDLGMSRRSLETMRDGLESHVVAVEYPGYGLTAKDEPSEDSVNAAVRGVFIHLTEAMGWPAERVVVMGRSLGSGPATRLAREFQPGALFLLAPFTSVKAIAGSILGATLASVFNLNQWQNKEEVEATTCPTILIHGLRDTVVPHTHSLELYRASPAKQKYVGLLKDSDHNRINWHAACDVYARPFIDTACPPETYSDRTLGVLPADVVKLSDYEPTSNGRLLVACAEAAWERRRYQGGPLQAAAIAAGRRAAREQRASTAETGSTMKSTRPSPPAPGTPSAGLPLSIPVCRSSGVSGEDRPRGFVSEKGIVARGSFGRGGAVDNGAEEDGAEVLTRAARDGGDIRGGSGGDGRARTAESNGVAVTQDEVILVHDEGTVTAAHQEGAVSDVVSCGLSANSSAGNRSTEEVAARQSGAEGGAGGISAEEGVSDVRFGVLGRYKAGWRGLSAMLSSRGR